MKHKYLKFGAACCLAPLMLPGAAHAKDGQFYGGIEGGVAKFESETITGASDIPVAHAKYDTGFDGDAIIGYDFGHLRGEAEIGYRSASLDDGNSAALAAVGGRTKAMSFMINGLADFGQDGRWNIYFGPGIGLTRVDMDNFRLASTGASVVDGWDSAFAFQAIAGLRVNLSRNLEAGLKYRYFNVDDVRIGSGRGEVNSHSLLASLIFNFGRPRLKPVAEPVTLPPPPPAPPPPPPQIIQQPPAPAPIACVPGPYIVFFDWDSAELSMDNQQTLNSVLSAYGNCSGLHVMLAGHADASGSNPYNKALSQRRAQAVAAYLTNSGIPGSMVSTQSFGEENLRVLTADGVREVQNRRVEITFGPGSGY